MTHQLPPAALLLRGFAVDFLTAHDPRAAERIMDPGYELSIGGHLLAGRDANYLPATVAQLDQFPGLCVTVHNVVLSPGAVAMRFTEHGVSAPEGRGSSWGGVALFRIAAGRLRYGWAEEDYFARKRQLKNGQVDPIRSPHPAPWDQPVLAADQTSEAALALWLETPSAILNDCEDIGAEGPRLAELIAPTGLQLSTSFTAGNRGAFHAVLSGTYSGGFETIGGDRVNDAISIPIAGIVDIDDDGHVVRAQICGDRLGLYRSLLPQR